MIITNITQEKENDKTLYHKVMKVDIEELGLSYQLIQKKPFENWIFEYDDIEYPIYLETNYLKPAIDIAGDIVAKYCKENNLCSEEQLKKILNIENIDELLPTPDLSAQVVIHTMGRNNCEIMHIEGKETDYIVQLNKGWRDLEKKYGDVYYTKLTEEEKVFYEKYSKFVNDVDLATDALEDDGFITKDINQYLWNITKEDMYYTLDIDLFFHFYEKDYYTRADYIAEIVCASYEYEQSNEETEEEEFEK